MDWIRLNNMVFYGYHGVIEHEKIWGARFEVDIELGCNLQKAIETDRLGDTIDYEAVYNLVGETVTTKKFYLIEALAGEICRQIKKQFLSVEKVRTTVRKPHAPIRGGVLDTIEVELSL